jgi:aryl-alcohol dehydrogenase-like predicted oxidoreductase
MPTRRLGASDIEVSRLSLGSWRTYERISRDAGLAVMHAAREAGITFLDDARYNDETGTAPIPTGYSEVVFGELFRQAGWRRDETVVSNKLWWEFWPEQSAADELDASLARMGLDYIDVIYANPPENLAGAERRRRTRRVTGAHGPRLHRRDLRQSPREWAESRRARRVGRRPRHSGQGASMGHRELAGAAARPSVRHRP